MSIGHDDLDGLDVSADALQAITGFPGDMTTSPWSYEAGRLPGLHGDTVEMPAHLLAELSDPFDDGDGLSAATAYQISTPAQLAALATLVNDGATNGQYGNKHYLLTADLDLSDYGAGYDGGKGWVPIGTNGYPFTGHFDGNGKTVSGLYISRTGSTDRDIGLFGYVNGGSVKNLGVVNANVEGLSRTGALVGSLNNSGSIENGSTATMEHCYATGAVNGTQYVGGLVGSVLTGGIVTRSAALNPSVAGTTIDVGRVAGWNISALTNNRSFDQMPGPWSNINPNSLDGGDMTNLEAVDPAFWQGLGWDETVWALEPGKLPVLKELPGQDGEPGAYLTGFPGENAVLQISPNSENLTAAQRPRPWTSPSPAGMAGPIKKSALRLPPPAHYPPPKTARPG